MQLSARWRSRGCSTCAPWTRRARLRTVEEDMLNKLAVPGLLDYFFKLDAELCQVKIAYSSTPS